jgi:molybdenum cofactor cytidylyltransferase
VAPRIRAVVLAAGAGRRFGGDKLSARLAGRPILQHVLDALAAAGVDDPIVVVPSSPVARTGLTWRRAELVVNDDPGRGLSSSLRLGWSAAARDGGDGALILLGDQPRVDPGVITVLLAAALDPERPFIAPRYSRDGAPNPVRVERSGGSLIDALEGDRGLGPLLDSHPELVRRIAVEGANPDVDQPSDLAALERAEGREEARHTSPDPPHDSA